MSDTTFSVSRPAALAAIAVGGGLALCGSIYLVRSMTRAWESESKARQAEVRAKDKLAAVKAAVKAAKKVRRER